MITTFTDNKIIFLEATSKTEFSLKSLKLYLLQTITIIRLIKKY